jgi:hypothetical protein
MKRKHRETAFLVVETGNALKQSDRLDEPSNRWIIEALDALEVHAVHTGLADLRRLDRLQELGRVPAEVRSRYVATDVGEASSAGFPIQPYAVVNVAPRAGGPEVRVGILAIQGSAGSFGGSVPAEPAEALRRYVPEVESKSDLIVLLTRARDDEIAGLARAFPAVDVIINGTSSGEGREFEKLGNTVAVESAHSGIALGILEVEWGGDSRIEKWQNQMMPLPPMIPDSPQLVELIDRARRDASAIQEEEAKKSKPVEVPSVYAGASACADCHEKAFKVWQKSGHAHAIDTLKKAGNQFNQECLRCHVTGFGTERGFVNILRTPQLVSVQCEACHGSAVDHSQDPQNVHPGLGLTQRLRRRVHKNHCLRCHTSENSPNFNFEVYWPKIAH